MQHCIKVLVHASQLLVDVCIQVNVVQVVGLALNHKLVDKILAFKTMLDMLFYN